MDSTMTRPLYARYDLAAQWAAHMGGGIAFLAAFGSLYLMCGAVAAGFDPGQALLMDVSAFVLGVCVLAVARLWRGVIARLNAPASVSCNFARKDTAPDMQMARMPEHTGHLVADVDWPVPA